MTDGFACLWLAPVVVGASRVAGGSATRSAHIRWPSAFPRKQESEVHHVNVVIIGLGYVGLPLAQEAVRAGLDVTGLDTNPLTVDGLNSGRSHIDDISDAEVAAMVSDGFRATTDLKDCTDPHVIVICVPTPLSASDGPDLTAVRAATETAWQAPAK